MSLFLLIIFLNILQQVLPTLATRFANFMNSIRFWSSGKREKQLIEEIKLLQNEQREISIMDEFARHARLQRTVSKLDKELKSLVGKKNSSRRLTKQISLFVGQGLLGIAMIYLFIFYRNVSVAAVPDAWTSYLANIISFPTGKPGEVGFIFWMMTCRIAIPKIVSK